MDTTNVGDIEKFDSVKFTHDELQRRMDKYIARMRQLADELEREMKFGMEGDYRPGKYGYLVTSLIQKLDWGTANMHLSEVARAATDADREAMTQ